MRYHALCDIPYAEDSVELPRFYPRNDDAFLNWRSLLPLSSSRSAGSQGMDGQFDDLVNDNYFREEIELDSNGADDGYAKIDVPDFKVKFNNDNDNSKRCVKYCTIF